ncbi:hypothetical protein J5N97_001921 [Dioscorea zingiberensis]|uniref:Pre-mRNA-processing factor 39 n=1 Tax=Dioscorea zingiberensis TaxID=325984 RepID=A0A9D5BT74_9LILI|nr:hypothetical protein J5N97_001921 [Dioscorea zingiberensis]
MSHAVSPVLFQSSEPAITSLIDEIRRASLDFDHWTSLISQIENSYPNDVEKICSVYDSFLAEFPLCHGYWRRYAEHKMRLCSIDKVVEVFERALQAATYCVPLWVDYCVFSMSFFEDPSDIRSWRIGMRYLDHVEMQGDFDWAVKLSERCLIPCANYPEFWMRYVDFMEINGGREIANYSLDRATQIFVKFVDLCGTIHEVRKVWTRHVMRLFPSSIRPSSLGQQSAFNVYDQQATFTKSLNLSREKEETSAAMTQQPSRDCTSDSMIELQVA